MNTSHVPGRQSEHIRPVEFLTRPPQRPNGGTAYVRPEPSQESPVTFFNAPPPDRPNGGGTVFVRPLDGGEENDKHTQE